MAKFNYAFGLSVFIVVVLISGCINSNESFKKAQPLDGPKVINLQAQQIIINDSDVQEILETTVKKKGQIIFPEKKNDTDFGDILSGIVEEYSIPEKSDSNVSIFLFVCPTSEAANKSYQSMGFSLQKREQKLVLNKIDIGDGGELYSFADSLNKEPIGSAFIIFRNNNIVVMVASTPDIKIQTLVTLALKQEAKIDRFLETIQ